MTAYTFQNWTARADMIASLAKYAATGNTGYLGNFLRAIVENDFMAACSHADQNNKANLPAFAGYLYNEMPSGSHGSPEAVKNWSKQGGTEGRERMFEERAKLKALKEESVDTNKPLMFNAQDAERLEELTNILYT